MRYCIIAVIENKTMSNNNMIINNRYQADSMIGRGSFSSVYSGKDLQNSKPVAIKLCKKQFKSFFKLEAEALSKVSGKKGFPKLIDYGEADQQCFLVMSLHGPTLTSKLVAEPYSLLEACEFGEQLIKTLKRLHDNSYIHRDIKPENIVLENHKKKLPKKPSKISKKRQTDLNCSEITENSSKLKQPDQKRYCLIDFGLAKKFWDSSNNCHIPMKTDSHFKGNLIFCSNNALSGIEHSRRDDLVSLCLILVFIVNRGLPWMLYTNSIEEMIGVRCSVNFSDVLQGIVSEFRELYNYANSLGFYQKPDYRYMFGLIRKVKCSQIIYKSEIVNIERKKRRHEKIRRTVVIKSKTEVGNNNLFLSSCSTIKVEAPDFSKDMMNKIRVLRDLKNKCEE